MKIIKKFLWSVGIIQISCKYWNLQMKEEEEILIEGTIWLLKINDC